jgi:Putative beta-barrel porin-2, OmpL-like. bbp2
VLENARGTSRAARRRHLGGRNMIMAAEGLIVTLVFVGLQDPAALAQLSAPDASPAASEESASDQASDAGLGAFVRSIGVVGFVDAYYSYRFQPSSGDIQLRNFDTKHNQFSFNLAELALERRPTTQGRLGFRMDFNVGPATDMVHAAEPGGPGQFRNLQQGYVSYLAPLGRGLQIDVGKMVTPLGAEVIETKDNWNYSRSLLFALAIPYYHMGARLTYGFSDKFTIAGLIVNGWNNVTENNDRKSFGVQATFKPTGKLSIVQGYMAGPEQTDDDEDVRQVSDTIVSYAANEWLSLMANYDIGRDRVDGAPVRWQGAAVYARMTATSRWAISPRLEWYEDRDGFTTGVPQTLHGVTLTSEFNVENQLFTRVEFRRDVSNRPFFANARSTVKPQTTLTVGLFYVFSSAQR